MNARLRRIISSSDLMSVAGIPFSAVVTCSGAIRPEVSYILSVRHRGGVTRYIAIADSWGIRTVEGWLVVALKPVTPAFSEVHTGDVHRGAVSFNHHDAAVGDMVELTVALQIVADDGIRRHPDVLVEDRAANAGPAADVAVIEDDGVL